MVEKDGYSSDRAVRESDFDTIARALAGKLAELGVLKPVEEPHVHVRSALEALVQQHGDTVYDMAWKDGNTVNRYREEADFCGAPGKAVQKRCHRLVLTIVPKHWSQRHT